MISSRIGNASQPASASAPSMSRNSRTQRGSGLGDFMQLCQRVEELRQPREQTMFQCIR